MHEDVLIFRDPLNPGDAGAQPVPGTPRAGRVGLAAIPWPHDQHAPASSRPAGPLRIGSLCTGYGGLDLAVTAVLDAGLAWCAETDRHAAAVLAARWPAVPNLGDITAIDWDSVPAVDLITAGWPCQDISLRRAGRRTERNPQWTLAPHHRCLAPAPTPAASLENVAALRTRGLARVVADLARLGYDTQWATVRASSAGAAHARARLFILAVRPGHAGDLAAAARPCRP